MKYAAKKFMSAVRRYQTVYDLKKMHLKTKNPESSTLLFEEIIRKTIKVLKGVPVKCAPVTGTDNRIVMTHNNRCFLIKRECHLCSRCQWIRNIVNKIETKYQKFKRVVF